MTFLEDMHFILVGIGLYSSPIVFQFFLAFFMLKMNQLKKYERVLLNV